MEKLNGCFESKASYFSQAIDFLSQYSWLYRNANTDILSQDLLDHIPLGWAEFLNLDQFAQVQKAISGKCDEVRKLVKIKANLRITCTVLIAISIGRYSAVY